MSLIKCFECGTDVSEYAEKCPTCGCPVDTIKDNIKSNYGKIALYSGKTVDITGIEDKILEENLSDWQMLWDVLEKELNIDAVSALTIVHIFRFNGYKFSDNYQETYEAMCDRNAAEAQAISANTPKCPTCGSTNISKIGTGERVVSVVGLGLLSKKINKSFKCKNCGHTW